MLRLFKISLLPPSPPPGSLSPSLLQTWSQMWRALACWRGTLGLQDPPQPQRHSWEGPADGVRAVEVDFMGKKKPDNSLGYGSHVS